MNWPKTFFGGEDPVPVLLLLLWLERSIMPLSWSFFAAGNFIFFFGSGGEDPVPELLLWPERSNGLVLPLSWLEEAKGLAVVLLVLVSIPAESTTSIRVALRRCRMFNIRAIHHDNLCYMVHGVYMKMLIWRRGWALTIQVEFIKTGLIFQSKYSKQVWYFNAKFHIQICAICSFTGIWEIKNLKANISSKTGNIPVNRNIFHKFILVSTPFQSSRQATRPKKQIQLILGTYVAQYFVIFNMNGVTLNSMNASIASPHLSMSM